MSLMLACLVFGTSAQAQTQAQAQVQAEFSNTDIPFSVKESAFQGNGTRKDYVFTSDTQTPLSFTLENQPSTVKDNFAYSGMAIYLGMAPALSVGADGAVKVLKFKDGNPIILKGDWAGYKGRFQSVLVKTNSGEITVSPDQLTINWDAGVRPSLTIITGFQDSDAAPEAGQVLDIRALQYSHLPRWMGALCRIVERLYKGIQSVTGLSWGISLILFAAVIKLILLPFSILTQRFQKEASKHKAALEPIFDEIKKSYKGETAHNKVMAAYKARGITPYYSLKPFMATLITLPVLIAIFNMLGEIMPLRSAPFLWFESLAYPDQLARLPARIPLLGSTFNLLPFFMAGTTVFSAYKLKSAEASPRGVKQQKRNLYLMAALFFVLFYPFPAAMVFYWALATLMQIIANKVIKS